jgi:stage II sporulation protein AA (anti-sigma F factor antagonist)
MNRLALPGFSLDEESPDERTRVLTARGELDMATAPALGQRVRRLLFWRDVARVIVDLSDVSFIDSSGVRTLILSRTHADSLDSRLLFVCPAGSVLRRVQAYGLDEKLAFHGTMDEALAA